MSNVINPRYKEKAYQNARLKKRQGANWRFMMLGLAGIVIACTMLVSLLGSIFYSGVQGFFVYKLHIDVYFDEQQIDPKGTRDEKTLRNFNYNVIVYDSLFEAAEVSRKDQRRLRQMLQASSAQQMRALVLADPSVIGTTQAMQLNVANTSSMPNVDTLIEKGYLRQHFNWNFFTGTDSSDAGEFGILGALVGSFWTILVCFCIALPIGVTTAIYLEEFAPKNRITDLIEVNINNLAAVPSIVFGLMGAIVFITWFHIPQSTALVGGLVLSLLTLPTIIVSARAALTAVSKSYKEAALGLGASQQQAVWHFVLPTAMPGIMTGTIIGLAGALGETAPLMMIGLVGFLDGIPSSPLDTTPTLATTIFNLFGKESVEFKEYLANSTIIVLLLFLVFLNGLAALLRNYYERRAS